VPPINEAPRAAERGREHERHPVVPRWHARGTYTTTSTPITEQANSVAVTKKINKAGVKNSRTEVDLQLT
jgi:hypothetical protein